MSTKQLSSVSHELVQASGHTAKNVIKAAHAGSRRLSRSLAQRWDRAYERALPELSAETAKNATNAQRVLGRYYSQGVAAAQQTAQAVVTELVNAAGLSIDCAAANAQRLEIKTGTQAITTLAKASLPAAVAVAKLAGRAQKQSAALVQKLA